MEYSNSFNRFFLIARETFSHLKGRTFLDTKETIKDCYWRFDSSDGEYACIIMEIEDRELTFSFKQESNEYVSIFNSHTPHKSIELEMDDDYMSIQEEIVYYIATVLNQNAPRNYDLFTRYGFEK